MRATRPRQNKRSRFKDLLFAGRLQAPCCFCKRMLFQNQATFEHVLPISKGGTWELDNLQISCSSCNAARQDEDFEAFKKRAQLTTRRERNNGCLVKG